MDYHAYALEAEPAGGEIERPEPRAESELEHHPLVTAVRVLFGLGIAGAAVYGGVKVAEYLKGERP